MAKRITLELPTDLYERLENLATAERRELKSQLLIIIERAVKMHEGRQRSAASRRMVNRIFGGS